MKQLVRVCGPKDCPYPGEVILVNTTSQSSIPWTRKFSPFFLGPVKLPNGCTAKNLENAWQYLKVYQEHVDVNGEITPSYRKWAMKGWAEKHARRYPMGKGAIPLYSLWGHEKLGYIEARQVIYAPLYRACVEKLPEFKTLVNLAKDCLKEGLPLYLWDFDGYDNVKLGLTLEEVMLNPKRKMGHAFVLAMMLQEACSPEPG